jgi:tape measure domain-containing protein
MAGRFEIQTVFKAINKVTEPVSRMHSSISKFSLSARRNLRSVNKSIKSINRGFLNVAKVGVGSFGGITAAATFFVKEFARIEDAEASFTPLLRGAKKAKQLVSELTETAAQTPFEFKDLSKAAGFLLPVVTTIKMLGDTAGGNADKLESITRGFTKAMLKGRTDMESLNIIAEAGVPIFTELAKSMKTKVSPAFFKMVSSGRISTDRLIKVFQDMTTQGGIFFEAMKIRSQTVSGRFVALTGKLRLLAADIGKIFAPTVKDLLKLMIKLTDKAREWVETNKDAINEEFIKFVEGSKKAIKGLWDVLKDMIDNRNESGSVWNQIKDAVSFISENIGTIAKFTAGFIALSIGLEFVAAALTIISLLTSPFVLLIALLLGAAALIILNWEPIKQWFSDLGDDILQFEKDSDKAIENFALSIKNAFFNAIESIKTAFSELSDFISNIISESLSRNLGGTFIGKLIGFDKTQEEIDAEIASQDRARAGFFGEGAALSRDIRERRESVEVTIKTEEGVTATQTAGPVLPTVNVFETGVFP